MVRHLLKPGEPKLLNQGEWLRIFKNEPLARKSFDKGSVLQNILRAALEAVYRTPRSGPTGPVPGGPAGGTGGGLPTDKPAPPPPPPPPPPGP